MCFDRRNRIGVNIDTSTIMMVAGKRNCCRLYRRQRSGIGSKAKKLLCALAYRTILDHLESQWARIADSMA
jgi:hypothetical protein